MKNTQPLGGAAEVGNPSQRRVTQSQRPGTRTVPFPTRHPRRGEALPPEPYCRHRPPTQSRQDKQDCCQLHKSPLFGGRDNRQIPFSRFKPRPTSTNCGRQSRNPLENLPPLPMFAVEPSILLQRKPSMSQAA